MTQVNQMLKNERKKNPKKDTGAMEICGKMS